MALMETLRKEREKAKAKKEADERFEKELEEYEKSKEPKTIGTAPIDKLKSVFPSSQEALERSGIEAPKKTREKFLGLFEIDEKQPDFLEEMASRNKSGGSIRKKKMKKGGAVKVRKANCKRGQGKALRGY